MAHMIDRVPELAPAYAAMAVDAMRGARLGRLGRFDRYAVGEPLLRILLAAPGVLGDPSALAFPWTALEWLQLADAYRTHAMDRFDAVVIYFADAAVAAQEAAAAEEVDAAEEATAAAAAAQRVAANVAKETSDRLSQWTVRIVEAQATMMNDTGEDIARIEQFLEPVRVAEAVDDMGLTHR